MTIGFVLQLDRAARMVAQHAVDPTLPGLEEVIDRLTKATFDAPAATPYEAESPPRRRARAGGSRDVAGHRLAQRAGARHGVAFKLDKLAARLQHRRAARRIRTGAAPADSPPTSSASWNVPPTPSASMPAPDAPPGAPIGETPMDWLSPAPWQ